LIGGEEAADTLLAALQPYVRSVTGEANGMDILVRAFANVNGLGAALVRDGRLEDAGQLRAFATGFSRRQVFFDFVDVGAGKERADFKVQGKMLILFVPFALSPFSLTPFIQTLCSNADDIIIESIKFFLESFQCKHLVLACGHDSGYAPFLGQFVGDKQVAERITLLEGSAFPAAIRDLGLKKAQFSSVFNTVTQPAVSTGRPILAWGRGGVIPTGSATLTGRGAEVRGPKAIGRRVPEILFKGHHNHQAQSDRLGPVVTNTNGRRVDKPLQVDEVVVERLKRGVLCYYFFLRGECVSEKCARNHVHRPLMDNEFDALWWLARQGQCSKGRKANRDTGSDCSDEMCIYGHRSGGM
jgi:hypothetical protein